MFPKFFHFFVGDAVVVVVEKAMDTDNIPVEWIAKQVLITDEATAELERFLKSTKINS